MEHNSLLPKFYLYLVTSFQRGQYGKVAAAGRRGGVLWGNLMNPVAQPVIQVTISRDKAC